MIPAMLSEQLPREAPIHVMLSYPVTKTFRHFSLLWAFTYAFMYLRTALPCLSATICIYLGSAFCMLPTRIIHYASCSSIRLAASPKRQTRILTNGNA